MFKVTIEPPYKDIPLIDLGVFETYEDAKTAGRVWLDGAAGRVIVEEVG